MKTNAALSFDEPYLNIIVGHITTCKAYKPAFGQGKPVSLEAFQLLYGTDPFYSWFGLNDPLVYAAHRAAGGITSVYRQIGLGSEVLFRQILQDQLGLTTAQIAWSYMSMSEGRSRRLSLDARVNLDDIQDNAKRHGIASWLREAAQRLDVAPEIAAVLKGAVFEVRQGYKSKDSKRQNADLMNAATAYSQGYLPVLLVLSTQIDSDIVERYTHAKWLILHGDLTTSPYLSTYAFVEQIVGYDWAGFFHRNAKALQTIIADILKALLEPENQDG